MRFVCLLGTLAVGLASCASTGGACYLKTEAGCARGTLTSATDAPTRCRAEGAGGETDLVYYGSPEDCVRERNASVPTGGNAAAAELRNGR